LACQVADLGKCNFQMKCWSLVTVNEKYQIRVHDDLPLVCFYDLWFLWNWHVLCLFLKPDVFDWYTVWFNCQLMRTRHNCTCCVGVDLGLQWEF
jgi:hypothetical protein